MAKDSLSNKTIQVTAFVSEQNLKNHTFVHKNCAQIRQQFERVFEACFGELGAVEAIVTEPITPGQIGRVLYDRALWPAETIESGKFMPDSKVEVVGYRENVLRVRSLVPSPMLT